jgi:hypothetical protein
MDCGPTAALTLVFKNDWELEGGAESGEMETVTQK